MIRILSTKKLLTNQRQFLLNAKIAVVEADFIQTESTNFNLSNINENLIFTSQNAVTSILQHPDSATLKSKKVFCVGSKTKALLEKNGYTVEIHTGYAADLAEIIMLMHRNESFTFFCGNLRRDVLPEMLNENEVQFNEIEVYQTKLTSQKMDAPFDGILFFSPSGVESYLQQNKLKNQYCFCIGNTTAEALLNKTKNIIVANQPTVENTIIQTINYFGRTTNDERQTNLKQTK